MITKKQLMELEMNTPVKYSNFVKILFTGKDERHVELTDSFGDKKKVYIELFIKYGSVI